MIWEKYKPKQLNSFNYNHTSVKILQNLVDSIKYNKNMLNLGFCGTESSGKITLCRCMLASLYGNEIHDLKEDIYTTKQNCTNYSIKIYYSKFHFEVSFCGLQYADKSVLVDILNKYFSSVDIINLSYKILLIRDFDTLSVPAQLALRRKIETNVMCVRFIFIINCLNKVENALLSRLTLIRCKRPTFIEQSKILNNIIDKEKIIITTEKLKEIIETSTFNLGKSFFYLYLYSKNNKCKCIDPEKQLIENLQSSLLDKKSYNIKNIREIISQLLLSKIKQSIIFKNLLFFSLKHIDESNYYSCLEMACHYENISQRTNKFSICIEAFLTYLYKIIH